MILDCIMFSGETDLLRLRLEELKDVVDLHIITEGSLTYQGNPKKPVFPESDNPKVRNHVVDLPESGITQWEREVLQRDFSLDIATQYSTSTDDLFIVADLDEIPHPEAISEALVSQRPMRLTTDHRNWYADYRLPDNRQCYAQPIIARRDDFSGAHETRYGEGMQWTAARKRGWHLSNVGSAADVVRKLESYSHTELNTPGNSLTNLENRRNRKLYAFEYEEWSNEEIPLSYTEDLPASIRMFPQLLGGK